MVRFVEVRARRVLRRYRYRDNWFWCRYSLNPYRGCQFACNYCDAITEKYLVHRRAEDFSRIIYVKTGAPELLGRELERAERDVVALSGVTDPYQPAEKKYRVTRRVLEVLRDHEFPVHVGTKSDLVLRDLDLLTEISEKSWCTVTITIITFDKNLVSPLEPFAPAPERRLEAVRKLTEAGVQAGVDFTPIVPYITDSNDNLRDVIRRVAKSGARYILPGGGMTLRSHQKSRFLKLLKETWPELLQKYEHLYGSSQNPNQQYMSEMNRKTFELCKEFGIPNFIQPPVFEKPLRENFEVANLLLLVAYFKEMREGSPYAAWAYHRAAQNVEDLSESVRKIYEKSELRKIPGVGKSLAAIIADFLGTGKCEKLERMKSEW